MMERFNLILGKISELDVSNISKYGAVVLKAMESLGDSKISDILGIEKEAELKSLNLANEKINPDYATKNEGFRIQKANETPTVELVENLEKYFSLISEMVDNYNKCTILYNEIIDKIIGKINEDKINGTKIDEINEMVKKLHNPSLANIDGEMVHHLYSDGEITLEKGGYLYGNRSRHMVASGFACGKYSFPLKLNENYTYAILQGSDASYIRTQMK